MSRSTPRKNRQNNHHGHNRHQSNQRITLVSDYESDAATYMDSHPPPAPPQLLQRTNTELNLSVLQRYLPSIRSILSIAANATLYTFAPQTSTWDKHNVEGPLFVCDQEPSALAPSVPRACVFVLNRKGLDNLILPLAQVANFEIAEHLLIFRTEPNDEDETSATDTDGAEPGGGGTTSPNPKVVGLWLHSDEEQSSAVNGVIVEKTWKIVREAAERDASSRGLREESLGPALQAVGGRKLNINDLFGRQNGSGG